MRGALAHAGAQVLDERNAAGDEALGLAFELAVLYDEQGKYDEAKAMHERVLAGKERTLGADHPDTLATVHSLATVLKQQGKLDEAKAMYERALAGQERTLGADHPDTLKTVGNLAKSSMTRASSTRRRR